ncbi:MAG: four helix bundle protein [Bacteroidota bacterium]
MSTSKTLKDLEVYQLAVDLSDLGWEIYSALHWTKQKHLGDQFIRSIDSVGANIAESYGLYHYMNRIRHLYISRGSLKEASIFWADTMLKRGYISPNQHVMIQAKSKKLEFKLNRYIQKLRSEYAKSKVS